MLPEFFEFFNPTRVVYGVGLAEDFSAELEMLDIKKFYIVTDKIISDLGLAKKVQDGLVDAGYEVTGVYKDVPENSELKVVKACSEGFLASGAEGWIAVGGGSVLDTAKAANILASEGGDLVEDYSGAQLLTRPLKPFVAIPTTSGTGSEVTMVSVIYDEENNVKSPYTDKFLLPNLAILDPEMTVSMPPGLTASTAMDALTHAIEAYVCLQKAPISDVFAEGAIRMILDNVVAAVEDGTDIDARGGLLVGSTMAGIAFSHSMVGCVHGMAHTVGGLYHVPHGIANGILLPHGMEFNFEEVKEHFAKLALVMGEDVAGLDEDQAGRLAIAAVRKATKRLNELGALPLRLRDVGVPEDGLEQVAEGTVSDGTSFYNPREVEAETILPHLKNAY